MKVARSLGWFNVDAMLATGEAWQLEEWIALEQLEPSGDDWSRSSMIASVFANELREIRALLLPLVGGDVKQLKHVAIDAFVPYRKRRKAKPERLTPAAGFAAMRMGIGV